MYNTLHCTLLYKQIFLVSFQKCGTSGFFEKYSTNIFPAQNYASSLAPWFTAFSHYHALLDVDIISACVTISVWTITEK